MSASRHYAAEDALDEILSRAPISISAFNSTLSITVSNIYFASIDAAQTYVNHINPIHSTSPIQVVLSRATKRVTYNQLSHEIRFPLDTRLSTATTLLHEVAHHLTPGSDHSAPFQDTLAQLLGTHLSPEVSLLYRSLLDKFSVNA